MRPSFFHHLHPPTIPAEQSRFRYTLGAGGLAVFLVLTLFLTGILEMYYYVPTPEGAGASIHRITFLVPYGALVRNLHFWSGQMLVVVVVVHMLRVIFTGAYTGHRRGNYWLGLLLLLLTLFLDFTGYVLRWDEGVRWALVAGTNLVQSIPYIGDDLYGMVMGGSQPGPSTLIRSYSWHVFGLALLLFGIVVWHIFKVRRDGGIAVPPPEMRRESTRITRFELARREGLAALLAAAGLLVLASFFPAPLASSMTETATSAADSHAPWFFLWVQMLLHYGEPFWMGVVVPFAVLLFLALLPVVLPAPHPEQVGRWLPRGARLAQILVGLIALIILVLSILSLQISPVQ